MRFITEDAADSIGFSWVLRKLKPQSPYGKHMKARMKALGPGCEDYLAKEWALTAAFAKEEQGELISLLSQFREIRGGIRSACQGNVLGEVELYEINRFLAHCQRMGALIRELEFVPPRLVPPCPARLRAAFAPGGSGDSFYLADAFSPELARLRQNLRELKAAALKKQRELEAQVTAETGKTFDPLGVLRINKLDSQCAQLRARKDIVLAAEKYTELEFTVLSDGELVGLKNAVAECEEQLVEIELEMRKDLSKAVAADWRLLLASCRRIGRLDLLAAKGQLARQLGWCLPQATREQKLVLHGFINPQVSYYLAQTGRTFQPTSLELESPVTVITGVNMGGKSVVLHSVGLACAMAQTGLLVPAKEFLFSPRDFIYISQPTENFRQGLSAFGAEISELVKVLPFQHTRGLYLLDEPARGTNPWEGAALVKALLLWLKGGNSFTLAATHFSEAALGEGVTHLQVVGLPPSVLGASALTGEDVGCLQEMMDYSIVPGKGHVPHAALTVAALLGLDPEIIAAARNELDTSL